MSRSEKVKQTPNCCSRYGRAAIRSAHFDPANPDVAPKLETVEKLVELAADIGCSLPELAIAFTVAHPGVTSAIIGPRTLDQLQATLKGASLVLDDVTLDRIDEIVPPGTNAYNPYASTPLPVLTDAARRRRPLADRAAA